MAKETNLLLVKKGPGLVYVSTVEIVDKRFLYERNCASDVYICLTENEFF